ncbi:MAG: 2'-5' RNA ligase family protein [Planctomycetes bacterium]|nr:2'-5' RNA ligase family protein [Planctomycetota bacterium]
MARLNWWLMPPEPDASGYRQAIADLRAGHGGPDFAPHITIGGGFEGEAARALEEVGKRAGTFLAPPIGIAGLSDSDAVHRCIYLDIRMAPELLSLHDALCRLCPPRSPSTYRPHLSLLYGRLPPDERGAIRDSLASRTFPGFTASRLALWQTGDSPWREVGAVTIA